ncbi:MAG: Non-ribosomal peptide synthase:Amino acid adenylation [Acidobacteria bacterium]|nr:Non-ribosomal peptide synthase:Amino acid adenylation [Acidobacteriota bacterium]
MSQETIQGFRLSPQQTRLWRLQQSAPAQSFRVRSLIEIEGELDPGILQTALESVVNQHEILRTSFQLLSGMTIPVQVIADTVAVKIQNYDLTQLNETTQQEKISDLFSEAGSCVVDYTQPSLLRIELLKLSAKKHLLLVSAPTLCADGPSLQRLTAHVASAYGALHLGVEPATVAAMQYADFAEWQHELLESSEAATALQHWHSKDSPESFAPGLVFEKARENKTHSLAATPVDIPDELLKQIRVVTEGCGARPATFLLGCWQTVLRRSTAAEAISVGVSFAGRKFPELEEAVGLLSSYLPITSHFVEDLSLAELLPRLSAEEEEAETLQEYFQPEQQAGGNNGIYFEARHRPANVHDGGLKFSLARQDVHSEPFKLKLVCEISEDALTVELQYDTNLFAPADAQLLAQRLATLIKAAVDQPQASLAGLEMLGATEQQMILVDFNHTKKDFPTGQCNQGCIHELFAARVDQYPDRIAVVFEEQQLSFAELNARANRLAHRLQRLGVVPDARVGLCFERSVDLIVGLLGILKAGGAYVPLDPGLPKSRLALMLADAGARVLVTRRELAEGLADKIDHLVYVEAAGPQADDAFREMVTNPPTSVTEENLAYVIFTSGSTGRPKGVAVEHRQLVNYANAIWERLQLSDESTFATVSTIAADLGNTVLFPPLLRGGTLHLISEERATNPDALADYCRRHPIDCLKIVPSHLSALLSATHPADLLPRRQLVLGGEACPWNLVEKISALAPDCGILNHYGPTEATVGATTQLVENNDQERSSEIVPLGRPLANARVYILDSHLRPAPLGAPGELHIGGAGVARGYVQRPETTAEKFIPDPYAFAAGGRLYKTGDLARQLADGRIEFLGRIDDQVKIHGFRIEPAEIEQALREHPSVAEAVVIAREVQPGEKRLVAYVVARAGTTADSVELKTFLQGKLPEYMMPRGIVLLDSLPLTRNGKVDRDALPEPDRLRLGEAEAVRPRNYIEETLAAIWSGVLGVEALGVHDNFFELGGDSILSIQIIARANQAGLKLSPRQLFEHQTIAELAGVAGTVATPVAEQGMVTGSVPLTPVQARFFAQQQPEPHHYNQAMLLDVDESLDAGALEKALQQLLVHHDALRLQFERTEQGWQQSIAPLAGHGLALEFFQEQGLEEQAAALQAGLNLESGPLVRVALFTNGNGRPVKLLLVIHHLLVDGVSWGILLEDLQTLYLQFDRGKQIELPAKTTSFKSWSEQLTAHAKADTLPAEAPYWLSPGGGSFPHLPRDFEKGPNTAASARTVTVALNPRETLALLMEVPAAYRTQINEVLLTALAQTLSQWTTSPSVLLDLEGHGREEILKGVDLSRTVGWFTTIFPVALDLKDSQALGESLRLVKEQLRAIPNRGIGYGVLRYLSGDADTTAQLNRQAQAEVRFNYLGQTDRALPQASLFKPAPEATGPAQSPAAERGYLLNIIGAVTGGELRLEWTFSENIHRRETIERLADSYVEKLRTLIENSRSRDAASFSPTDFPSAKLNQEELNKVLAKLRG